MKKNIFIVLAAAIALSAPSCNKESAPQETQPGQKEHAEETVTIELNAVAEATKTSLNTSTGAVTWNSTDKLSVFDGYSNNEFTVSGEVSTTAKFTGTINSGATSLAVLYPYSNLAAYTAGAIVTTLPHEQNPSAGSITDNANLAVASVSLPATDVTFKNVCSIIQFTIGMADTHKQVTIKTSDDAPIAGEVSVNPATAECSSTAGSVSEIVFGDGVNYIAAGTYYILALPQSGKQMCFVFEDGVAAVSRKTETVSFGRNHIMDFGTIDDGLTYPVERYASVTGAGNKTGVNWANAYGTAELKAAIASAPDGREFYLAAGDYVLSDDGTKYFQVDNENATEISFFGGYDESGNATSDPTVFSGEGKYAIFYVTGKSTLNFKDITFADALAIQDAELVKNMRGAISVNDDGAVVNLDGCTFMDNAETGNKDAGIGSGQEGGSALYAKAGAIYANKCIFTGNNSGSRGGVIRTENNSVLFMNECVFDGNGISREAYGRVAFTKSNFCINKCIFHEDYASANVSSGVKNDPTLNLNFNNIVTNCTIIEEAKFSGTGVIRSETVGSDGYKSVIMNNIIVNSYVNGEVTKIGSLLLSKVGLTSSGYNMLVSQNKIINAGNIELKGTDENLSALAAGVSYLWDPATKAWSWTGLEHTFADSDAVEAEVRLVEPTKGVATLGAAFADWVKSVGGSF